MRTVGEARAVLMLDGFEHEGHTLQFSSQVYTPADFPLETPDIFGSSSVDIMGPSKEMPERSAAVNLVNSEETCEPKQQKKNDRTQNLESDVATEALLKELICRRSLVYQKRIPKMAMDDILKALRKQNLHFTSELVLKRKKSLLQYYGARKRAQDNSWRFFNLVAQLEGDVDFSGSFAPVVDIANSKFQYQIYIYVVVGL